MTLISLSIWTFCIDSINYPHSPFSPYKYSLTTPLISNHWRAPIICPNLLSGSYPDHPPIQPIVPVNPMQILSTIKSIKTTFDLPTSSFQDFWLITIQLDLSLHLVSQFPSFYLLAFVRVAYTILWGLLLYLHLHRRTLGSNIWWLHQLRMPRLSYSFSLSLSLSLITVPDYEKINSNCYMQWNLRFSFFLFSVQMGI